MSSWRSSYLLIFSRSQERGYKTDPRNGRLCNCDGVIEPYTRTLHALVNMLGPVTPNRVTKVSSSVIVFMPQHFYSAENSQDHFLLVNTWSVEVLYTAGYDQRG